MCNSSGNTVQFSFFFFFFFAYHFISQNPIETIFIQGDHPVQTTNLVVPHHSILDICPYIVTIIIIGRRKGERRRKEERAREGGRKRGEGGGGRGKGRKGEGGRG